MKMGSLHGWEQLLWNGWMDGYLCDVGEGDCDSDSDCKAGLICGASGSCPQVPGTDFEQNDECCIKP